MSCCPSAACMKGCIYYWTLILKHKKVARTRHFFVWLHNKSYTFLRYASYQKSLCHNPAFQNSPLVVILTVLVKWP